MSGDGQVLVLVVESDPSIQALEASLLDSLSCGRISAPDGRTAVQMARQFHPWLFIAEILVPKRDGLRVCRPLKLDLWRRDVKVLIFSEPLAERRAREVGTDAFLRKPREKSVFLDMVHNLMRESSVPQSEKRISG